MARGKKNCPDCGKEHGARVLLCPCGHEFSKPEKVSKVKHIRKSNKVICSSLNISLKNNKIVVEFFGEEDNIVEVEQLSVDENNVVEITPSLMDENDVAEQCSDESNTVEIIEEGTDQEEIIPQNEDSFPAENNEVKRNIGQGKKVCPNCDNIVGARNHICPNCQFEFVKKEKSIPKVSNGLGKGKKMCPKCNVVVGAKTKLCSCGYDFINKELVETELSTESIVISPIIDVIPNLSVKTENIIKSIEVIEEEYDISNSSNLSARGHAERILDKGPNAAGYLMNFAKKRNCWSHIDWDYVKEELEEMNAEIFNMDEY